MNIRVLGGKGARKMLLLKAIWTVASIGVCLLLEKAALEKDELP